MKQIRVAYCTGFWCTNIGNGFFSLGIEYILKKLLGNENVTIVSDIQTYTTSYGKRLYPDKYQLEFISKLDVDYIVLAGPVISKYFLRLWKDIIVELNRKGIGYILLSAGMMKITEEVITECKDFFEQYPPYILSSRDEKTYMEFGKYAENAYNGICFSFFAPDFYSPCMIDKDHSYWVFNFDKIKEPEIYLENEIKSKGSREIVFGGQKYLLKFPKIITLLSSKTDRFTDALIYALSIFPQAKRNDYVGNYNIIRTDHRFHPHFRSKIYSQNHSFCADLPYAYLNIYANSKLTLSDRVHACAVTLAFGNSAMMFANTARVGLLERVGVKNISDEPVKLDMDLLQNEKIKMVNWLKDKLILSNVNGEKEI